MIEELTLPNLDAYEKILESLVEETKDTPYKNQEMVFMLELTKVMKEKLASKDKENEKEVSPKSSKPWYKFW